tara:strand:+ start:323 stop:544 length:222 start_codon:yes stop_codon:yes gene_type:complete
MSRNRLERGQKPKRRGSGNKSKQFDATISDAIREGGLKGFMDSPGMQGPAERAREQQMREMYMKEMKKRNPAR